MPKAGFYPQAPNEQIQQMGDISATTSGAALSAAPTLTYVTTVILQNDPASAGNALIGDSGGQRHVLTVGSMLTLSLKDPTQVFVKAVSTATVHVTYIGWNE